MIIVTSRNSIDGFDKYSGKQKLKIPIFKSKDFVGALSCKDGIR